MGANDPSGMANLEPRGHLAGFMLENNKHCYILNTLALGLMLSEKKILKVLY